MLPRFRTATYLSIITALWCWVLTAGYTIWKFGYVDGYLELGEIPFNPTIPITYLTLFMLTIGAFGVTFVVGIIATMVSPPRWHLWAVLAAWCIGAGVAAIDVSFLFLDHGGGTWLPHEALRATFFHPIVTPFWIILGLAGTASLTRPLRTD
ncbi:hypothetical protein L0664_04235 [Octadecabacter sp. G9-8]|uniref:Uncharacterized protein n=1 Tax=Octadecabacter dasysiphoniae TaxID=2909341 RepID=A0ABS9CSR4_9RHOB|nr:hypothetical protein [Octadecabacter dasysiphoniae]MCF2870267.1 hypothetical protein [Octadecabacter dasysiphoniae]